MIKSKRAFTIVEIMVVISVIAILAAILLSALGTGREKVQINSTKTAMKGFLAQFVEAYSNDPIDAADFLTTDTVHEYPNYVDPSKPKENMTLVEIDIDGNYTSPPSSQYGSGDDAEHKMPDPNPNGDGEEVWSNSGIDGWYDQKFIKFFEDGRYASEKSLRDNWGTAYKYKLDISAGEFSIWSFGPNQKDEGRADDSDDIVMKQYME